MYVDISTIPDVASCYQFKGQVRIYPQYEVQDLKAFPNDGERAVISIFDSNKGTRIARNGSWGGSNPFVKTIDDGGLTMEIERGVYIIVYYEGGPSKRRVGGIYLNPADAPAKQHLDEISDKERQALNGVCMVSSYRKGHFDQHGLGKYGIDNPYVQTLIEKGLVAKKGSGIGITPQGRNVLYNL